MRNQNIVLDEKTLYAGILFALVQSGKYDCSLRYVTIFDVRQGPKNEFLNVTLERYNGEKFQTIKLYRRDFEALGIYFSKGALDFLDRKRDEYLLRERCRGQRRRWEKKNAVPRKTDEANEADDNPIPF